MNYEEACIYKTYSYFCPGLCLNIFGYTFNQILDIKVSFAICLVKCWAFKYIWIFVWSICRHPNIFGYLMEPI